MYFTTIQRKKKKKNYPYNYKTKRKYVGYWAAVVFFL